MSGGEDRKVSKLLELVQKRVEQCLHHYMNKREVINALSVHDNVEPFITDLVWKKLEEQNRDFFRAYYVALLVKDQIMEFNRLLSEQLVLMHQSGLSGIGPILTSNGSHVSPSKTVDMFYPKYGIAFQQISTSFAAQNIRSLKGDMEKTHGSSVQSLVPGTTDMSAYFRNIDISPSFLSQNPNIGVAQTVNMIKPEAGCYAGSSPFHYNPSSNFPDSRQLIGDASFSSVEANAHHINDTLLDDDASLYGFLEPIPSTFDFPELTADFSNVSESSYGQSFAARDTDNSMNLNGVVQRFDPSCESLMRQNFDHH